MAMLCAATAGGSPLRLPANRAHAAGRTAGDAAKSVISLFFHLVTSMSRILDTAYPRQYGPPGFGGAKTLSFLDIAGVESMADGARNEDEGVKRTDEAALSARLRRLGEGLDRLGASRPAESHPSARGGADMSGLGRALKLSAEMVGGVLFGAGAGLLIDYALGTSPWGAIVFLMLGFAAGVLSVMRSAGVAPPRGS
jgi:ATP synthase protein I